ncbi:hypothetical protein QJQ45_019479 [Haematococcus lacustris]|nr:hypothetical protein QJQ45_019479 [Haematococcus lacustris]
MLQALDVGALSGRQPGREVGGDASVQATILGQAELGPGPGPGPGQEWLDSMAPSDWVHTLYLQPPRGAEVLVQACGRTFVTVWEPLSQQWVAQELADVAEAPPDIILSLLPRLAAVAPTCLQLPAADLPFLSTHPRQCFVGISPRSSTTTSSSSSRHFFTLTGSNLWAANTHITARMHNRYLHVERTESRAWELLQLGRGLPQPLPQLLHCSPSAHMVPGRAGGRGEVRGGVRQSSQPLPGASVVHLAVHGITAPGLLLLECWSGRLLINRKLVVVVADGGVARELGALEGSAAELLQTSQAGRGRAGASCSTPGLGPLQGGPKADDLLTDLGCWVEFVAAMQSLGQRLLEGELRGGWVGGRDPHAPCHRYEAQGRAKARARPRARASSTGVAVVPHSPLLTAAVRSKAYQSLMVDAAVQLLEHSCSSGWTATASMLVKDLTQLGCSFAAIKHATRSLPLLHRAMCSGCPAMVEQVLAWGEQHGQPWDWGHAEQPTGLTALHIAAVSPHPPLMPPLLQQCQGLPPRNSISTTTAAGPPLPLPLPLPPQQQQQQASLALPQHHHQQQLQQQQASLADWVLWEFEAAWQYWHGAVDVHGSSPADLASHFRDQAEGPGALPLATTWGAAPSSSTLPQPNTASPCLPPPPPPQAPQDPDLVQGEVEGPTARGPAAATAWVLPHALAHTGAPAVQHPGQRSKAVNRTAVTPAAMGSRGADASSWQQRARLTTLPACTGMQAPGKCAHQAAGVEGQRVQGRPQGLLQPVPAEWGMGGEVLRATWHGFPDPHVESRSAVLLPLLLPLLLLPLLLLLLLLLL